MSLKRRTREIVNNVNYKDKFTWFYRCVYCGASKDCEDHVLPLSLLDGVEMLERKKYEQGLNLVPSCNECNVLAAAEPFFNIRDKRFYIQEKLRDRYEDLLIMKDWSEEDLDELGPMLKENIEQAVRLKKSIERRIQWPRRILNT